ncbi:hypothetical protein R3P38DRAFT_1871644 [Favolaschia claudopus]|uniref:F-box domain-containing protein n=1 Tax=Favolaschia claudopus TaxID=2862362 RepID=A0AAW0DAX4_9AGAR
MALTLLLLPLELQLIIVNFLAISNGWPFSKDGLPKVYTRHVAAVSLVCRHLRRLCLPLLFSHLKISRTDQLYLLSNKCEMEPEFASRIRKLNLSYLYSPVLQGDILPTLLPRLRSLIWLDFPVNRIDATLLSIFNSHPTLVTVAICDIDLVALKRLSKLTSLSLSKLRLRSALSTISFGLQDPTYCSLARRGLRIIHLNVLDASRTTGGPDTLIVSGLEELEIKLRRQHTFPMAWPPTFVPRHDNLWLVTFNASASTWMCHPDVPFASQFLAALDRESPNHTIRLVAFSIARTECAADLENWPVVHAEFQLTGGSFNAGFRLGSSLAPHLSSLKIQMPTHTKRLVKTNDFIASISLFQSLERLELQYLYKNLFQEKTPWPIPPFPTSKCINAHFALRWLSKCLSQRLSFLRFIRIIDRGVDVLPNRQYIPWELDVVFKAGSNGEVEICRPPVHDMAEQYSVPDLDAPLDYS